MSAPTVAPTAAAPAPPHAVAAVEATAVARAYGEGDAQVHALRGVSLSVPRGQLLAIMGPSGSGKSTLLHVLAGLDAPDAGTVAIGGQTVTGLGDTALTRLRRDRIGFVFQAFNLLPVLTAEENVVLPLQLGGVRPDPAAVTAMLERVGLADRRDHRPAQLSGGQQQRVAVARALLAQPDVVFADEPTGNLDSHATADVLALLREATEAFGQTTVMVTHDPRAAACADRVVLLADGRIVADLEHPTEADVNLAMERAAR